MKTSMLCCSSLLGIAVTWAAPVLAQDAPAAPTTVVVQPSEPAPAPAPAPGPSTSSTVVNAPSGRAEGSPRLYPGLIWGGVTVWAVAYSAAAITGGVANDACTASSSLCVTGREILYVPIVGPFAALSGVNGTGSSTMKTMLALDGAFQLGGVAMTLTGIILSASSSSRAAHAAVERKLIVAPYATGSSAGLGALGHF
jgi:hypothetical protein